MRGCSVLTNMESEPSIPKRLRSANEHENMSRGARLAPLIKKTALSKPLSIKVPCLLLTEVESNLFYTITKALEHWKLKTTVRVAGGWVRDKLLGMESDDMDIAVDDMSGAQFAGYLTKYISEVMKKQAHGTGTIKSNPDKSKHLETATLKLFDMSVDIANLRTETYTTDSRIPQISNWAVEEDALRRDLTINALFYNINNDQIEDFTGTGLYDLLEDKVIRTPLSPDVTFRDDPLRILRILRFAQRFRFRIHDDIYRVLANGCFRDLLLNKVSRERMGIEILKILKGPGHPISAFRHLCQFKLADIIFALPPPNLILEDQPIINPHDSYVQGVVLMTLTFGFFESRGPDTEERRVILLLSSFLWDTSKVEVKMKAKSCKRQSLMEYICWHSIRLPKRFGRMVVDIATSAEIMCKAFAHFGEPGRENERQCLLLTGRALFCAKENWVSAAYLAEGVLHLRRHDGVSGINPEPAYTEKWKKLREFLSAGPMRELWRKPKILTGRRIMDELKLKGGPILGPLVIAAQEWFWMNPSGTIEQCLLLLEKALGDERNRVMLQKDPLKFEGL